MVRENEIRDGEIAIETPPPTDAGLVFIGRIRTPWTSRLMTPRHGRPDGPICRIEIFDRWQDALEVTWITPAEAVSEAFAAEMEGGRGVLLKQALASVGAIS